MEMRQHDEVDIFGAEADLRKRHLRQFDILERSACHRPAALEASIDEDEPPLLHGRTGGDERIMHRHFDEPLIAADRAAAEEIGWHVTAAKAETPDRMIATHF
jgi:hypothetical protein